MNETMLPNGWRLASLAELGEVNRGRSRHRPRYADHLYGGAYPFIQTGDIRTSGGRITSHSVTYNEAGLAQSRLWPACTMCITIAANIAETAILTYPACFPDSVVGFIADPTRADVRFVEYAFRMVKRRLQQEAMGSVQDNINLEVLSRLRLPVPSLGVQQEIAAVLGSLDDKIEQNRRTVAKLEGLARAVFKAWFVDFEPVKAKAAGATAFPGMPPETFAALPTRLTDSELGPVPEGWEVATMGDIGTQRREQIAPEATDGETPYIGLEHMPRRDIALSDWGTAASVTSSKFRFRRGDILFGKLRPYFHKVGRAAIDGVCSTDIVVLHPKKPEYAAWMLMLVSSDEFVAHTDRSSAGTKMPRTNWKDMAAFKTTLPPSRIVLAFQEQIGAMLDLITASIHESRRLATLRDYLLPRLLSGRVRVGAVSCSPETMEVP